MDLFCSYTFINPKNKNIIVLTEPMQTTDADQNQSHVNILLPKYRTNDHINILNPFTFIVADERGDLEETSHYETITKVNTFGKNVAEIPDFSIDDGNISSIVSLMKSKSTPTQDQQIHVDLNEQVYLILSTFYNIKYIVLNFNLQSVGVVLVEGNLFVPFDRPTKIYKATEQINFVYVHQFEKLGLHMKSRGAIMKIFNDINGKLEKPKYYTITKWLPKNSGLVLSCNSVEVTLSMKSNAKKNFLKDYHSEINLDYDIFLELDEGYKMQELEPSEPYAQRQKLRNAIIIMLIEEFVQPTMIEKLELLKHPLNPFNQYQKLEYLKIISEPFRPKDFSVFPELGNLKLSLGELNNIFDLAVKDILFKSIKVLYDKYKNEPNMTAQEILLDQHDIDDKVLDTVIKKIQNPYIQSAIQLNTEFRTYTGTLPTAVSSIWGQQSDRSERDNAKTERLSQFLKGDVFGLFTLNNNNEIIDTFTKVNEIVTSQKLFSRKMLSDFIGNKKITVEILKKMSHLVHCNLLVVTSSGSLVPYSVPTNTVSVIVYQFNPKKNYLVHQNNKILFSSEFIAELTKNVNSTVQ
jgi:hypothetical protein